jgi:hypothetical protein
MADRNIIRVELVGVGNWARYGHIPALKLLPEYEIVAHVDGKSLTQQPRACATAYADAHAGVDSLFYEKSRLFINLD